MNDLDQPIPFPFERDRDQERKTKFSQLADTVGSTPLYTVAELNPAHVFQKLEFFNPSGSHYDRVYLPTIQALEEEGLIKPGDELRDITSGSAGISLSWAGKSLDYNVRITVPSELPDARVEPMSAFGATVVRCGSGYIQAASKFQRNEIHQMIASGWQRIKSQDPGMKAIVFEKDDQRICYVNHSENNISPQSFASIGKELIHAWQQPKPYAVALAMGNWTSIAGIATSIRHQWPDTRIVGYEGDNRTIHNNYGTTVDGVSFRFKDPSLVDEQWIVTNTERDTMDQRINQNSDSRFHAEQYQLGHSSLMGLVVAEELSQRAANQPVICLAYDQKIRY